MQIKKIFLASSSELKDEREEFEIAIGRKNKRWKNRGFELELVIWEDFIDAMSSTRLQDEYNKAIKDCDIFIMLFHTKVGKYTAEEFETAFQAFQENQKPKIYTYFNTSAPSGETSERDQSSLQAFKDKLRELKHFKTEYASIGELKFHFFDQVEKLEEIGFFAAETASSTALSNEALFDEIKKKLPFSSSLFDLASEYEERLVALAPSMEDELLQFKGQWYRLAKNIRMGIISQANSTTQTNILTNNFLEMLEAIERIAKNK